MSVYKKAPLIVVVPPDWPIIVQSLVRNGYPKAQIAQAVCCSRETIYGILRGATPNWEVGEGLLRLHRKVMVN